MNFYKSAGLALDHLDKHQGSVKGSLAAAGIQTASQGEAKRILACEDNHRSTGPKLIH
jgi:putative methyltransferase